MSKTSHFLIGLMIAAVAFLAAMRGYQAYERYVAAQEDDAKTVLTFHNVPIQREDPAPQPQVARPLPSPDELRRDIFLEDPPLTEEQLAQQALQTVASILADYKDSEVMNNFNRDLRKAAGGAEVDLSMLSGPDMAATVAKYPQVQQVVAQYAKDPEFIRITQEIFKNPQFVQSVMVLQRRVLPGKTDTKN